MNAGVFRVRPRPTKILAWLALVALLGLALQACASPWPAGEIGVVPDETVATLAMATPVAPTPSPKATGSPTPELAAVASASVTAMPDLLPVSVLAFDVAPAQIEPGEAVTLTWQVDATQASIFRLDEQGRLTEPSWVVPISGTLVLTTSPTMRNAAGFVLYACDADWQTCDQAQVSVQVACPDRWFFPDPPPGCPGEAHPVTVVTQRFEHGLMLRLQPGDEDQGPAEIVILYDDQVFSPRWTRTIDSWTPGMAEEDPDIVPPPGYAQPMQGLGKAWRELTQVRERLGWAVGEAEDVGFGFWQCGTEGYARCYVSGPDDAIYVLEPEMSGWFIWPGTASTP